MRVLHAGCGLAELPPLFSGCDEVRLDIDAAVNPHIVASIIDLGEIGPFDAVYSSHNLEHLYPHEVGQALAEFHRVARDGFVFLVVPDVEGVEPTDDMLFDSPAGPITGKDLIHGHQASVRDNPHMAHHTGFTQETLRAALESAGFERVIVWRMPLHNVFAIAFPINPTAERFAAVGTFMLRTIQ